MNREKRNMIHPLRHCVVFCRSLFVLFLWVIILSVLLSVDLGLQIIPMVYSNLSCKQISSGTDCKECVYMNIDKGLVLLTWC